MASLPDYVTAAKPVPQDARAAWYKNTAQTYAGIMLWVVFWRYIVVKTPALGGSLAAGLGAALIGVLLAALFCHFLTYLVPALLGMTTGRPLYVVGTSTYGVHGGFIMPGFLMGCLQFGWLAVNACIACSLICESFGVGVTDAGKADFGSPVYWIMGVVYVLLAVGVGLKGIQYVARVATFMPLIPLVILLILLAKTASGIGSFDEKSGAWRKRPRKRPRRPSKKATPGRKPRRTNQIRKPRTRLNRTSRSTSGGSSP
jgi:cytosine permease